MAINIPILTEFQDNGIKAAKAAFGNFKTAVGDAQGGMGKFKAGSKVALDAVAANAASFAVAGGLAFAKFAMDGVKAFQDLALAAEKFATSTGLAIQDASRYMEVAGDIGIPVDAVEAAIGRLNKTIGADPDKVRDLGVDLVYLKDGSLDVNATFLNTIERIKGIKDPAEKARVASQLLGKGWQSMSTLIEMGANDLSVALGNVSDSKVIDPKELAKAKQFRDTMDKLKDTVEDLSLSLGEGLIPLLVDVGELLDSLSSIGKLFEKIPGASWARDHFGYFPTIQLAKDLWNGLGDAMGAAWDFFSDDEPPKRTGKVLKELAENGVGLFDAFKAINGGIFDVLVALNKAKTEGFEALQASINETTEALMNADTAWKVLTGNLDQEVALDNAKQKLKDLEDAAKRAFGSGAQADIDAYDQAAADFVGSLSAIAGGMSDISSKEILIRYKTQGPAAALELANYLARGAEYGGLSPIDALNLAGISTLPARANGGPVMSGTTYLVGERGPELFTPSSSGNITPNGAIGGGSAMVGGANITVNVNGGDPNSIVRALQQYVRQSGPVPVNTRAM
jgi:hypothetical protein